MNQQHKVICHHGGLFIHASHHVELESTARGPAPPQGSISVARGNVFARARLLAPLWR